MVRRGFWIPHGRTKLAARGGDRFLDNVQCPIYCYPSTQYGRLEYVSMMWVDVETRVNVDAMAVITIGSVYDSKERGILDSPTFAPSTFPGGSGFINYEGDGGEASASPISCVVNDVRVFPKGIAMHHCAFTFLQIGTKIIAKNVALGFHGTPLDWPEATDPALFTLWIIYFYSFW